jgi:predicted permease
MMAESLVMCLAGGALGVVLATWGVKLVLSHDAGGLPRVDDIHLDWQAVAFAFGISVLTAVVLGIATAGRQGQRDLRSLISNDGRTLTGGVNSQRVRDLLVVAQVALTIVLLMAAGLLTRSFIKVLQINPGFDTSNALVMDMALAWPEDSAASQRQIQFQTTLLQRLENLPGAKSVAITNAFPLGGGNYSNGQFIEMNTADELQKYEDIRKMLPAELKQRAGNAGLRIVSDKYFDAMSIPVIRGRGFEASDVTGGPEVAVISESLAKVKWPDRDPLGRYIQFGNMDGDMHGLRVVGVVADVREFGPEAEPQPLIYASYRQRPGKMSSFSAIVRGPDPSDISLDAQKIVRDLDPQLPVVTRTVQQAVDNNFSGRRFSLMMVGTFSAVALALATLGLYGVISYLVAQRTREIGIRSVLGAPARTLMALVISKAARLALIGTALGALGAMAFAKLLKSLLFGGVSTADPLSMLGVIATISAAVMLATALPVRRALHISPMTALRDE